VEFTVSTSFDLHRTTIQRMLRLPGGIVYRDMERRVRRVEAEARRRAPGSMGDGNNITVQIRTGPGGDFQGVINSRHPATLYVLGGTRPHVIRPVRARALRFTVGGRTVYAKAVMHPGTQPNRFLQESLRAAL
jgi:hypothetical protein